MRRHARFLLLAVFAGFYFLPLGTRALWDSDEGRYAEIAREMIELGDWISPHLNHVLYFEKPPLMYWLTALSFKVFGYNEFAARFWLALFGLATVWLVMRMGERWRSPRLGLLAGAVLGTSTLFVALTQYLVLDLALTFWTTLFLASSVPLLGADRQDFRWRHAAGVALAVAGGVLTKGLVAIVLPVLAVVAAALWLRRARALLSFRWIAGLVAGAALAAPWFVWVSLRQPFFPYFFFVHEHLTRYLTSIHRRTAPFYFFLPVFLAGFLPWTVFVPQAIREIWRERRTVDAPRALWWAWAAVVFFFFSFSQSKLVAYLLPLLPATALLVADTWDRMWDAPQTPVSVRRALAVLVLLWAALLVAIKAPAFGRASHPIVQALAPRADLAAIGLATAIFLVVGAWGMRRTALAFWGVCGAQLIVLLALLGMAPALDGLLSTRDLAVTLNERAAGDEKIVAYGVSYENHLQSLAFYTRRRIAVYGHPGELLLGRDYARDASVWFVHEPDDKGATLILSPGSWVVTDRAHAADLQRSRGGDYFHRVQSAGRLVLLRKEAVPMTESYEASEDPAHL